MIVQAARRRADILLVEKGLFGSRASAQEAIAAGLVTADGVPVRKASDRIPDDAEISAEKPHPWVSRGGVKLADALDRFGISPAGLACLDVGASTGGFTDVLLSRGAARVYAVDVGQGQLHPRLDGDPRVVRLDQTDARRLERELVPDPIGLAVVDVSFISLKLVIPVLASLLAPSAALVALVKPQFEAGRAHVGRGGIVRDEAVRQAVLDDLLHFLAGQGYAVLGAAPSPIAGRDGNREFLIGARRA